MQTLVTGHKFKHSEWKDCEGWDTLKDRSILCDEETVAKASSVYRQRDTEKASK